MMESLQRRLTPPAIPDGTPTLNNIYLHVVNNACVLHEAVAKYLTVKIRNVIQLFNIATVCYY